MSAHELASDVVPGINAAMQVTDIFNTCRAGRFNGHG